ncbi:MAG TPA: cytochrome P450 [Acidimicrobiales bacterium]|nr:cytochrome P450 [Acidimicrobiales bacterium]
MTEAGLDPTELLFAPSTANDPREAYRTLRERCPVAQGSMGAYVSRFEDVAWALRHPEVFSSEAAALDIGQEQPLIPLQVDPPLHTQYRRLLNPWFTPKKVAELEPDVRVLVRRLIDAFAPRGECDFHEEYATPLPSTIFLRLMGLPQSDLPTFLRWRDNVIRPDVDPHDLETAALIRKQTGEEISSYFEEALEAARRQPGDGLLGLLVSAEMDGRRLSREELLGMCHLLLLGGLDTVTATLDCMIAYLATHPEHRRAIVADPSLIGPAVEELLRRESPVQVVPRVVRQDITLRGVELREGQLVSLVIGAANHDEEEFSDPDEVVLGRDGNRHVAFGGGHHFCLGAHLARLELRVGLEEFHRRIPEYRIPEGTRLQYSPGIRQAESLPLVFSPEGT